MQLAEDGSSMELLEDSVKEAAKAADSDEGCNVAGKLSVAKLPGATIAI